MLSVLSGAEALYVAVRKSARPLGLAFNVGMRLPAYLSGSGKAMLALAAARRGAAPLRGQDRRPPHAKGPRNLDALQKELALTRRRGYSIDDEGVREGVYSFGAPVFDASGASSRRSRSASARRCSASVAARAIVPPSPSPRAVRRIGGEAGRPSRMSDGRRRAAARLLVSDDLILETRGLTKEFKGFVAVSDVNLKVRRGSIHALIGPNGAGKTTCSICSRAF